MCGDNVQGLPAWNLLLMTRRAFAVPLGNLADVPAVLVALKATVCSKHAEPLDNRP